MHNEVFSANLHFLELAELPPVTESFSLIIFSVLILAIEVNCIHLFKQFPELGIRLMF